MCKTKLMIKENELINSAVLFARIECCACHEPYFVRVDDPRAVSIPSFIEENEVFPSDCPICDKGMYAMFITYIEHEFKTEGKR